MRHERIVQPIGFCSEDGALVQEFVKGPTLASWLGRNKDAPVEWSLLHRIAIDVCFGLCYLHENRRVHGDVSTANVLLSEGVRQNTWRAKLTAVSFANATSNHPIGSRAFDIFGFGIVLGELVNRKLPLEELRARAQDAALPKIVDECLNLPSPTVIEVVLLELASQNCKTFPIPTEPSDSEPLDPEDRQAHSTKTSGFPSFAQSKLTWDITKPFFDHHGF